MSDQASCSTSNLQKYFLSGHLTVLIFPPPKLRPYGGLEMCVLLFLFT